MVDEILGIGDGDKKTRPGATKYVYYYRALVQLRLNLCSGGLSLTECHPPNQRFIGGGQIRRNYLFTVGRKLDRSTSITDRRSVCCPVHSRRNNILLRAGF